MKQFLMHVEKLRNFPRPSHFKSNRYIEKLEQYLLGHKNIHHLKSFLPFFTYVCVQIIFIMLLFLWMRKSCTILVSEQKCSLFQISHKI